MAGDIALYDKPAARPTGGAGCVAMLVGANAPLVLEPFRGSYMKHVYDFYKGDFKSEYPLVDGHYSNTCYLEALDSCYERYRTKYLAKSDGLTNGAAKSQGSFLDTFEYFVFHAPTCKLVSKAYGRLLFNDMRTEPNRFEEIPAAVRMFSYGSGLASTLFSLRVKGDTSGIAQQLQLRERLEARTAVSPEFYNDVSFSFLVT